MAPLNEEDDEDEDSTVFDVKYRYCCIHPLRLAHWALISEDSSFYFSAGLTWQGWGSHSVPLLRALFLSFTLLSLLPAHTALPSPAPAITLSLPQAVCTPLSPAEQHSRIHVSQIADRVWQTELPLLGSCWQSPVCSHWMEGSGSRVMDPGLLSQAVLLLLAWKGNQNESPQDLYQNAPMLVYDTERTVGPHYCC